MWGFAGRGFRCSSLGVRVFECSGLGVRFFDVRGCGFLVGGTRLRVRCSGFLGFAFRGAVFSRPGVSGLGFCASRYFMFGVSGSGFSGIGFWRFGVLSSGCRSRDFTVRVFGGSRLGVLEVWSSGFMVTRFGVLEVR